MHILTTNNGKDLIRLAKHRYFVVFQRVSSKYRTNIAGWYRHKPRGWCYDFVVPSLGTFSLHVDFKEPNRCVRSIMVRQPSSGMRLEGFLGATTDKHQLWNSEYWLDSLIFYTVSQRILVRGWWEQNGNTSMAQTMKTHLESRFWKICHWGSEEAKNKTSPKEPYPIATVDDFSSLHYTVLLQNLRFNQCMNKWASSLFFFFFSLKFYLYF